MEQTKPQNSMKPNNPFTTMDRSVFTKNLTILFGILLSMVMLAPLSTEKGEPHQIAKIDQITTEAADKPVYLTLEGARSLEKRSQNKYQNFLTSYFLHDSPTERRSKMDEGNQTLTDRLMNLRLLFARQVESNF
jgi:hypothetical protein